MVSARSVSCMASRPERCFFEKDPDRGLARRALVEAFGTLLLVFAIAGSGLVHRSLFHDSSLVALMISAVVTGGALAALIVAFGSASGGHFNPLISLLQSVMGERAWRCALWYVLAQVCGGMAGAMLADIVFGAHRSIPGAQSAPWRLGMSELVSTAALMTVVFACSRSGRRETGPFAVGMWITAASLATPSASLANPAITLATLLVGGPLARPAPLVLLYLVAECAGALVALPLVAVAYPRECAVTAVAKD
jgi:glycerol uptake facilitator-like aquaporin